AHGGRAAERRQWARTVTFAAPRLGEKRNVPASSDPGYFLSPLRGSNKVRLVTVVSRTRKRRSASDRKSPFGDGSPALRCTRAARPYGGDKSPFGDGGDRSAGGILLFGDGAAPSPPTPLPRWGEGRSAPSPPAPLPRWGEGRSAPSPPAPLPRWG